MSLLNKNITCTKQNNRTRLKKKEKIDLKIK